MIESRIKQVQKINKEEEQRAKGIEDEKSTIIINKGKIKGKEFKQYRASIPKKYADFLDLNKSDFKARAFYDKINQSIKIEITKI